MVRGWGRGSCFYSIHPTSFFKNKIHNQIQIPPVANFKIPIQTQILPTVNFRIQIYFNPSLNRTSCETEQQTLHYLHVNVTNSTYALNTRTIRYKQTGWIKKTSSISSLPICLWSNIQSSSFPLHQPKCDFISHFRFSQSIRLHAAIRETISVTYKHMATGILLS